ncbi:hypothetical protein HMPREF0653_00700 [Prevotella disiens JCM 6334 = ATCC 29426]|uniref:Virulence protein n=2 Tax=Prevotella disiens TaxID=28130 RepID=A0A379E010_9BACT|nr:MULTISPECIES: hypothetical protein [Prevotella]ERJ79283.1 hypothetical protein HMPREF0653_00700 [Prevotella disiens JCM 6334 = ATCC 29426]MDR0185681.1 hypothetical protein [Prevotella brunnea]SUB85157.1 Virulence protein [Prevotella disiens]SUB85985.1 Virulence protein [Prevotella disiens]
MKTINNPKRKVSVTNQRSYFDWTDGMQVVRRGNGEIAMTESELVKFFGVTWRKLNHRLQTIMKSSNLHPDERVAGEEVIKKGKTVSYSPFYPLLIIIALSFLLNSMEAHLFRMYISRRLQTEAVIVTPIFLLDNTKN